MVHLDPDQHHLAPRQHPRNLDYFTAMGMEADLVRFRVGVTSEACSNLINY